MTLTFRWVAHLSEVPKAAWDALAKPLATPFLEWDWLHGLEVTGCVGGDTGWLPFHLTGWRGETLVAAAPLYVKGHSWGEFVFDQSWARVALSLGLPYYPKLVGMSPFTPVPGYRFLISPGENRGAVQEEMLAQIDAFCIEHQLGGFHLLHIDPEWREEIAGERFHSWLHHGLVWRNRQWETFDDYLGQFRSHRRKTIRRERRRMAEQGIHFQTFQGETITQTLMEDMFGFYIDTCAKYWGGSQYLNLKTFRHLQSHFSERLVLMRASLAKDPTLPVAMSLLIRKDTRLFGRYWGCLQDLDGLHFETCYYQPIQWAIAEGIQSYDAGSGGSSHKTRRGFPPEIKYSLHRLYDPRVDQIWAQNIGRVNRESRQIIDQLQPRRTGK